MINVGIKESAKCEVKEILPKLYLYLVESKESAKCEVEINGSKEDLMLETLSIIKALSVVFDTNTKTILDFLQNTLNEKEQKCSDLKKI
ncbi:hypothetical protein [Arcobacter sp. CECT 9188]|uniref:hypothetical protein n=1 Tax=Arcobacter sp. CECT 9188 TaxID=2044505 RepID=UPI000DEAA5C6|nr:hypothetical protein [Arcobacter sp. CECT 9188]RBQ27632.1 hypothetical protein CRU88_02900 [Arcobacter sp. CECT 9188]